MKAQHDSPPSPRPDSIIAFAVWMERKLQENDHKTGWADCALGYLRKRLGDEVGELKRAIESGKPAEAVVREAADVANFAMMIADVYSAEYEEKLEEQRMDAEDAAAAKGDTTAPLPDDKGGKRWKT